MLSYNEQINKQIFYQIESSEKYCNERQQCFILLLDFN